VLPAKNLGIILSIVFFNMACSAGMLRRPTVAYFLLRLLLIVKLFSLKMKL